ncbi:MAG: peroxiredoxin [Deltaproteobacteria bacterium]|nr:MAG: peroxiredoxin [Deltaproteobacteria bacterium]
MPRLEGQPAPPFALPGSDGRTHALGDYAGKTVVLYFYPKDNTPGCTKEACAFGELYPQLQRQGAVVLGISRDSLASHDRFIATFGLPFVLLSDPDGAMMQAYGAYGEKLMYGKKVTGTIRSTVVIGPDGTVLKHWHPVKDAAAHPQQVADFLAAR